MKANGVLPKLPAVAAIPILFLLAVPLSSRAQQANSIRLTVTQPSSVQFANRPGSRVTSIWDLDGIDRPGGVRADRSLPEYGENYAKEGAIAGGVIGMIVGYMLLDGFGEGASAGDRVGTAVMLGGLFAIVGALIGGAIPYP